VALALAQIAPLLTPKSISHLITFFVPVGLGDRSPEVRKNMLAAALAAVDLHGKVRYRKYCQLFRSFESPNIVIDWLALLHIWEVPGLHVSLEIDFSCLRFCVLSIQTPG
jgi:hypothetical protein